MKTGAFAPKAASNIFKVEVYLTQCSWSFNTRCVIVCLHCCSLNYELLKRLIQSHSLFCISCFSHIWSYNASCITCISIELYKYHKMLYGMASKQHSQRRGFVTRFILGLFWCTSSMLIYSALLGFYKQMQCLHFTQIQQQCIAWLFYTIYIYYTCIQNDLQMRNVICHKENIGNMGSYKV